MQLSLLPVAVWDKPALLLSDLSISSDGYSIQIQTRWSLWNFGRSWQSRTSIWFALDSERFCILMNFSKHSNLRLSKTTESFQTNFNLCLVSFDCAVKGRLCRGREPATSPRERRSREEEMSWQWFHIRLLRSADQNVWMVPLAGSRFHILYLTGWSRFSVVPTRALLLNTSLNNDEFIFTLWVFWAPCFASKNWKPTNSSFFSNVKVISRSCSSAGCSWTFEDGCSGYLISMDFSMLNFDFATLTLVQSTPESSKGAHESPQMINQFMKTIVPNHR